MDTVSTYSQRLASTSPYLTALFGVGFVIALWDPHPKLILTVALGISTGMLILGPYASAALYGTGLQAIWHGHLRWPLCMLLAVTAVLIMDYFMAWTRDQLLLGVATATIGTVLGHDATLAVLELRRTPGRQPDVWMVVSFPVIAGLAALAGYCSLGFGLGIYHLLAALLR